MKRLPLIVMLISALLVAACSSLPSSRNAVSAAGDQGADAPKGARAPDLAANQIVIRDAAGSAVLQKVGFRPGVSTATVERLAKRYACSGGRGAGLVTEKGPVEVYRMECENGRTFLAQCEFRQCRPLR